jgi:ABC-2 type transport system permease protein
MILQTTAQAQSRSLWRIYALEARYEFLKQMRLPAYVVPTLAFPLVFYFMFGVALPHGSGGAFDIPTYMLATYGAFGVMNVSLFGFGVGVATERGQGWMLFKRASPMPPFAYFTAKLATILIFSLIMAGSLFLLGATAGGVRLAPGTWLSLLGSLTLGTVPFAAFGLAVAYWAGPNSAVAVLNILALPSAFGSGMWIPIQMLPPVIKKIALFLPPYHYAQLALRTIGMDRREPVLVHVAALAAFTVLSLVLAWIGYRRDDGRTFG